MFFKEILATVEADYNLGISIFELKAVGAGLAVLGMGGAGVGIGYVFGSLLHAIAKNPDVKKELFIYAILGFALTESIALFCLSLTFVILNS